MIHESVDKAKKGSSCPSQSGGQNMDARQQQEEIAIKASLSKIKHKIFVLSGKGGVGKSSVSANLAASLSKKGYKTGLMDVDVHGPSIAQMLGLTGIMDISENQLLIPKQVNGNLKVVSVQSLMQDQDQAIIWRGPAKTGMIKQFVSSVDWGELDFLIIDAPPGTGDEPLTVVQTIPDALGVIVTTPQEVALADIRKSISFCKTVRLKTLGIVENMASFKCPHCNEPIDLFSSGGGEKTAKAQGLEFLGSIPFDTQVVVSGDKGIPVMFQDEETEFTKAFETIVENITKQL
ncbi:Mrp/NBP35 family ATP-binding protein [Desulfobacula phenolica]|uniref:Iron-sulfur cluster carrier protein n=1 Tax=Desulfobacula phenolica TaxID=90732 RepID=A0A1H2GCA4_9BACT|nr:Mrp/NBP35 family ATP-binding protein [Desulfobacula phenolica]SDU17018.1 Chromosome partitioning ATPase, Mrp family, contains Fe-S cluster [Desulfobacula phenolica]